MHTDIDYSQYSEEEKRQRAIQDVESWLGMERFEKIVAELRKMEDTEENRDGLHMMFSFAGIQGFPVKAMCDEFLGKAE